MPSTATLTAAWMLLAGSTYAQGASGATPAAMAGVAAASSSATAGLTVHVIQASDPSGTLTFSPNSIQAAPGDMVQWQFYPKNHSVVMSSFAQPCIPIQQSDPGNATNAFFSGFMPVASPADDGRLTYTIMVMDTKPIWYYCSQGKHCQEGMVGVINPPANSPNTIEAYAASAQKAQNNVSPSGSATGGTASSGGAAGSSGVASPSGVAGSLGVGAGSSATAPATPQGTNAASALHAGSYDLPGLVAVAVAAFFTL